MLVFPPTAWDTGVTVSLLWVNKIGEVTARTLGFN